MPEPSSPHRPWAGAAGELGVPDEPANTLRPSERLTRAAFAVFDPSLALNASTVTASPGFNEFLVQPRRIKPLGFEVSTIHRAFPPSGAATSRVIQPCGFIISHFTTVPLSVMGLSASNSAANEWCAIAAPQNERTARIDNRIAKRFDFTYAPPGVVAVTLLRRPRHRP